MTTSPNEAIWQAMLAVDGDSLDFEVERRPEEGVSFSADALDLLGRQVMVYVGTRVMRRWATTAEPPTVLRVTVTVAVQ